jgi:NADH-quinone oxidoreductase subunit M
LQIRVRERFAVLTLALLILLGGVAPQSSIALRQRAAEELLREREFRSIRKDLGEIADRKLPSSG